MNENLYSEQRKAFSIDQQSQNIHQFQTNDSESTPNFKNVEDIKIRDGNKYSNVMIEKICILKEKINQNTSSENLECLTNELEIMKMLNHPNVLKAESETINYQSSQPSIIIEYCETNLEQAVKSEALSKVQKVFSIYQIAEGMKYIHSRRIIHKNLKPTSIQITSNGTIKISEFENSRIINSENLCNEEKNEQMSMFLRSET